MKKVSFLDENDNHKNADLNKKVCDCDGCVGCSVYKHHCNIFTTLKCQECKNIICANCLFINKCYSCYEKYLEFKYYEDIINQYNNMSLNIKK